MLNIGLIITVLIGFVIFDNHTERLEDELINVEVQTRLENQELLQKLQASIKSKKKPKVLEIYVDPITVTAAVPIKQCTDNRPWETASGKDVSEETISLSDDLIKDLNLKWGDEVELVGIKEGIYLDSMHSRWQRRADIYLPTVAEAKEFGKKTTTLIIRRKVQDCPMS